jgi:hypothetical protein
MFTPPATSIGVLMSFIDGPSFAFRRLHLKPERSVLETTTTHAKTDGITYFRMGGKFRAL